MTSHEWLTHSQDQMPVEAVHRENATETGVLEYMKFRIK